MYFDKALLQDLIWENAVETKLTGHSRWSVEYECIFEYGGKHYLTTYSSGATESQDERPYEYQSSPILCPEVVQKEVTVLQWFTTDEVVDNSFIATEFLE